MKRFNKFSFVTEKEEDGIAPHFATPLKPLMVEEHKPAILSCTVTGTPVPEIKWYRGEQEIKPKKGIEIAYNPETNEAKLTILEPTSTDVTIYRVRAINKFGRAECRANLLVSNAVNISKPEVLHAPRITKPVPALIAEKGEPLVLFAEFESTPQPEVKWFRNGVEITPLDNRVIKVYNNTTELKIPDITKKDSGKYEVRVKNLVGEARSSGSVTVQDHKAVVDTEDKPKAPRFIEALYPQTVNIGEVVIMEASVESYPTASFQWFHETTPLVSSAGIRIVTKDNRSVLLVKGIKPENAGIYTCRAENVVGSVTCTASVNILETTWEEAPELISPSFVKRLSPVRVMDGESVDLTCIIKGKPTPKIQWFHDKKSIKEGKEITILQDSEGVCSLAISEVFPEDAGEYTCQAVNPAGETVCTTSVVVDGTFSLFTQVFTIVNIRRVIELLFF